MKRLLNLLLVLLLAIPAAHGGAHPAEAQRAMQTAMNGAHAHHRQHRETPPGGHHDNHVCIGCIAPIDIDFYRPVRPAGASVVRASLPADASAPPAHTRSPEPPPPRVPA